MFVTKKSFVVKPVKQSNCDRIRVSLYNTAIKEIAIPDSEETAWSTNRGGEGKFIQVFMTEFFYVETVKALSFDFL